jgi:hypothetical protein
VLKPLRELLAPALLGAAVACTFSYDTAVLRHELMPPAAGFGVNSLNVEERLKRGYIPEVIAFLTSSAGRSIDAEKSARLLSQAKLESGDFAGAEAVVERLLSRPLRNERRAEAEWVRAQAAYWRGDFGAAATWAESARAAGRGVPEGWVAFLRSGKARRPYHGPDPGERFSIRILVTRPRLPRFGVRINDRPAAEMILDSGASISLVTESVATQLGLEVVEGAITPARGLHEKELTMRLGWARSVALGTVTLHDVPFGILPDGTLTFETAGGGSFMPSGVLGAHLMKEFDWRIEFAARRLQAIRLDGSSRRGGPDQNLFFRRLKPMVRVSFNRQPWSFFLLDSGSEPTMVTPEGLKANRYSGYEPSAPVTLEGIGKSQVSWSKVSNITLGIGRYMVWFKNLVVNEGGDALGDGIVGMSFLAPFDVELRFGLMTLSLQRAGDRPTPTPSLFEGPTPFGPP